MLFLFWPGMIIGLLVSIILIFFPRSRENGNILLGFCLLTVCHCLLVSILYQSGDMVDFPHISRTGNLSAYLVAPLFFLFVRYLLYRGPLFRKWDLFIFLPSLLNLIDFLPYYLLSGEEKSSMILAQQLGEDHFLFRESSFLPDRFHFYFRQIYLLGFLILSIRLLWINRNLIRRDKAKINRDINRYLWFMAVSMSISILPPFFRFINMVEAYTLGMQALTLAVTLIGSGIFLFFHPSLLYGFYWENESQEGIDYKNTIESSTEELLQLERENQELCQKLNQLIQEEKLFLKKGFSINDLSVASDIPVYKISPAINACFHTNFNQWINQFRIEEFEQLICEGYHEKMTLDGIASKCGFSNRTTFISSFKKVKGITPSQFLKDIPDTVF